MALLAAESGCLQKWISGQKSNFIPDIYFTGFTFPVEALPACIRGLAAVFPLRHYYLIYVQESIFGSGFAGWYPQMIYLLLFLALPPLAYGRLRRAYIDLNFPRN